MSESKKIIVVGGNAAGPAAAAKAKRTDPAAEVILVEAGEFISTGSCELPYLLAGEIDDYRKIVFFDDKTFAEKKGVKVLLKHRVEEINRRAKILKIRSRQDDKLITLPYDKLVLTTGSRSRELTSLKARPENLFYFKTVKDYLAVKEYCSANNVDNLLIIGAGYIGVELCEAFRLLGKNVILFDREQLPMPSAERECSALILDTLEKEQVRFLGGEAEPRFLWEGSMIVGIKYDGYHIPVDMVVASLGFAPETELAVGARLEIGKTGGIKTDNRLKTSDPNIYAAGDNIEVINSITKRPFYLPQATLAHSYGHIAGGNSAGGNNIASPALKNIALKVFGNVYASVGLTEREGKGAGYNVKSVYSVAPNLVKVMPDSKNVFGKIVYERETYRPLGASFYGNNEVIGLANNMAIFIENKIDIRKLSEIQYNYTPPASPFVNILSVLGRKIKQDKL